MAKTSEIGGKLIVFEGIDGSGISTQIRLLETWLAGMKCLVHYSRWEASELVREAVKRGKKQQLFTPTTFSLLNATDFAHRYETRILPMLKAGFIVLCDRYVFTNFARDAVRGCDPAWLRELYEYAVKPDLTFYLDLPLHMALERVFESREQITWFEAGMDLGLSADLNESYRLYQGRIQSRYMEMISEYSFVTADAAANIHLQQETLRRRIAEHIDLDRFKEKE